MCVYLFGFGFISVLLACPVSRLRRPLNHDFKIFGHGSTCSTGLYVFLCACLPLCLFILMFFCQSVQTFPPANLAAREHLLHLIGHTDTFVCLCGFLSCLLDYGLSGAHRCVASQRQSPLTHFYLSANVIPFKE